MHAQEDRFESIVRSACCIVLARMPCDRDRLNATRAGWCAPLYPDTLGASGDRVRDDAGDTGVLSGPRQGGEVTPDTAGTRDISPAPRKSLAHAGLSLSPGDVYRDRTRLTRCTRICSTWIFTSESGYGLATDRGGVPRRGHMVVHSGGISGIYSARASSLGPGRSDRLIFRMRDWNSLFALHLMPLGVSVDSS